MFIIFFEHEEAAAAANGLIVLPLDDGVKELVLLRVGLHEVRIVKILGHGDVGWKSRRREECGRLAEDGR